MLLVKYKIYALSKFPPNFVFNCQIGLRLKIFHAFVYIVNPEKVLSSNIK